MLDLVNLKFSTHAFQPFVKLLFNHKYIYSTNNIMSFRQQNMSALVSANNNVISQEVFVFFPPVHVLLIILLPEL